MIKNLIFFININVYIISYIQFILRFTKKWEILNSSSKARGYYYTKPRHTHILRWFLVLTCRNTAAQQGHLLERSLRVNLDYASRLKHGVFTESGCVEKMEDGFSIFTWKPTLTIVNHHGLERVHPRFLTLISFLTLTVDAISTLSVENRNNMVTFFHVNHTFTNALNNPVIIS